MVPTPEHQDLVSYIISRALEKGVKKSTGLNLYGPGLHAIVGTNNSGCLQGESSSDSHIVLMWDGYGTNPRRPEIVSEEDAAPFLAAAYVMVYGNPYHLIQKYTQRRYRMVETEHLRSEMTVGGTHLTTSTITLAPTFYIVHSVTPDLQYPTVKSVVTLVLPGLEEVLVSMSCRHNQPWIVFEKDPKP